MHAIGRGLQQDQIKTRKIAREALQVCASQKLTKIADKDLATELAQSEHNIASEFTMQKTYKDPSKNVHLCPVIYKKNSIKIELYLLVSRFFIETNTARYKAYFSTW